METEKNLIEKANSKVVLYDISRIQEQFWILYKLFPENKAYNIPSISKIEGEINLSALEESVNHAIHKHEMLRASFEEKNSKVYQKVRSKEDISYKIEVIESGDSYRDVSARDQILEEIHGTFDLTQWPLFRIKLFRFKDNISILTIVFHHIIVDLRSKQIFEKELSDYYNSIIKGAKISDEPPAKKYSEYSEWLNDWLTSQEAKKKLEDWKNEIPKSDEILEVATDFPRPKVDNLEGMSKHFSLDPDLSRQLKDFLGSGKDLAVNSFVILLAAYSIFLHRLSSKSKIIIGVPLSNRKQAEFSDTFGCFVNIVPVLVEFREGIKGIEIIKQVRQSLLKAHRKQEVPFLDINKILRTGNKNTIFQAGFTFQPPMRFSLDDLTIQPLNFDKKGSQLELFLTMWENEDNFEGYLEYSTQIYRDSTAERFIQIYKQIISSLVESPDIPAAKLNIISDEEGRRIYDWNDTDREYESDICLHERFERQVKKTPDSQALVFGDSHLTYDEFNKQANSLANHLIQKGIRTEDIICICMERSPELMIAIYAIHKAGGAYLPVDPNYPTERLEMILSDARPALILTKKQSERNIPEKYDKIYLDEILTSPLSDNYSRPDISVHSKNLAYVIYTSGSTGKPKGVMIEHHSVINKMEWMQEQHPLNHEDTIMLKTPVTFDVSVWEIFWWMFNGAKLAILPPGGEKEPKTIIEEVEDKKVTTIIFVPSMFSPFVGYVKANQSANKLSSLKWIIQIGEALSPQLVNSFNELLTPKFNPLMVNTYGPTEATVAVSWYDCPKEENVEAIYIGKPIKNTKLLVVNQSKKLQPVGIPGELIITGVNLSRGYLNRPELNSERFIDFEYLDGKTLRAYRTGDLVKWLDDGNIDFIGRVDNQVKIRGYRIELGDIESKLLEYNDAKMAAAIVNDSNPDNKYIIGYVVLKKPSASAPDKIKKFLSKILPDYMIPAHIVVLDDMPLNTSGKIDRKSLPEPDLLSKERYVKAESEYEKELQNIWRDVLDLKDVGITHNFFDIGGNSLLAIRIVSDIKDRLNIPLEPIHILEYPNIRGLAKYLSEEFNTTENEVEQIIENTNIRKRGFSRLKNKRRQ